MKVVIWVTIPVCSFHFTKTRGCPTKNPSVLMPIKEEILWNNRFIKIGQESHYDSWIGWKTAFLLGISRIKNILNAHDSVLSFQDLKDTFDVRCTFLDYGGLLTTILNDWKNAISHGNQAHTDEPKGTQLLTAGKVSADICSTNVCWEVFLPSINWILFLKRKKFTPSAV